MATVNTINSVKSFIQLSDEFDDFVKNIPSNIFIDKTFKLEDAVAAYMTYSQRSRGLDEKILKFMTEKPGHEVECITLRDNLEESHKTCTNIFLTTFPHAEIPYGAPCVGKVNKNTLASSDLRDRFPSLREIRGDGNCFWTALTVSYLENLSQEKDGFVRAVSEIQNEHIKDLGKDSVLKTLSELAKDPSQKNLEKIFASNHTILPFIHYFKMKASAYIKEHSVDFIGFITTSLETYCRDDIEAMGQFADHHAIIAISKSLNFPFVIIDLKKDSTYEQTIFPDSAVKDKPKAVLSRFKEHYSLCYANHVSEEKKSEEKPLLERTLDALSDIQEKLSHDQLYEALISLKTLIGFNGDIQGDIFGEMYQVHKGKEKLSVKDDDYGKSAFFSIDAKFNVTNEERLEVVKSVITKHLLSGLTQASQTQNIVLVRRLHDQLGKVNPDLRNRLHGHLYEAAQKQGNNTSHADFGRAGFRNEEGCYTSFAMKLTALAALK